MPYFLAFASGPTKRDRTLLRATHQSAEATIAGIERNIRGTREPTPSGR